jgi:hypothetical protein
MTLKRYLTFIFLLVAMLLVSFKSFANEVKSAAAKSSCVCPLAEHNPDESGSRPDHYPAGNGDDCCDCEGCCPDATEPASFCGLRVTVSLEQLSYLPAKSFFPKVYLTIFVPPQSCFLN